MSSAVELLRAGSVAILSGAGLSTESGIPDYRGPSGAFKRNHVPMTYQTFTRNSQARRRYWARGYLGWQQITSAQPNRGHRAVAQLEHAGIVTGVITQNVDGLHTTAGSRNVIDLHGRLDRVTCLECGERYPRQHIHDRLAVVNADWNVTASVVNPDGDAEIPDEALDGFVEVACEACDGMLKPDVVYFGENVPVDRVDDAWTMLDQARSLLVLGSSLHVFSGRRFVVKAAQQNKPVVIINSGPTRCDDIATLKIDAPLGDTLTELSQQLASTSPEALAPTP